MAYVIQMLQLLQVSANTQPADAFGCRAVALFFVSLALGIPQSYP